MSRRCLVICDRCHKDEPVPRVDPPRANIPDGWCMVLIYGKNDKPTRFEYCGECRPKIEAKLRSPE